MKNIKHKERLNTNNVLSLDDILPIDYIEVFGWSSWSLSLALSLKHIHNHPSDIYR